MNVCCMYVKCAMCEAMDVLCVCECIGCVLRRDMGCVYVVNACVCVKG